MKDPAILFFISSLVCGFSYWKYDEAIYLSGAFISIIAGLLVKKRGDHV